MRHTTLFCAVLTIVGTPSLASAVDFEEYARVISATPKLEQINIPRQECRTEYENVPVQTRRIERPQEKSAAGGIIGGIAGGLLGNQVGGGNGRVAATAAGAIVGAIVGDRADNAPQAQEPATVHYESRPVRQCRTIDQWETRTVGYSVTYEFNNRTYTTIMPYDPGQRLRLQVSITPRP